MPVAFFSRHQPTPAQDATMRALAAVDPALRDVAQPHLIHGGEILFPALPEGELVTDSLHAEPEAVEIVREAIRSAQARLDAAAGGARNAEWVVRQIVALVAPAWVAPMLLTAGFTVISFENAPSARQRGVFICTGAVAQSLYTRDDGADAAVELVTYRIACPVPEDEQIESALTPTPRG